MAIDYTIKPPLGAQLDWGNSLTRNIAGCWLFNERAGIPHDVSQLNPNGSFLEQGWKDNGFKLTGTTSINRSIVSNHKFTGDFTAFVIFRPTTYSSDNNLSVFSAWNTGGQSAVNEWTINANYAKAYNDKKASFHVEKGTVKSDINTDYVCNANEILKLCGRKHGTKVIFNYQNNQSSTNAASAGVNSIPQRSIKLGCIDISAQYNSVGIYYFAGIWDRALSDDEVKALVDNPYQIVRSPLRRLWTFASRDAYTEISATRQVIAGVRAGVTGQRQAVASVRAQAQGSRQVVASVRGAVQGARSVVAGVLQVVSGTRQVAGTVCVSVTGTRELDAAVRAAVAGAQVVLVPVRASVVGTRQFIVMVGGIAQAWLTMDLRTGAGGIEARGIQALGARNRGLTVSGMSNRGLKTC